MSIALCCTVCKGIVELHGGTISATSEGLGKGSCFTVQLPITSKRAISVDELCPSLDTRASLTRKAESIPSRLMLQFRVWFRLSCITHLFGSLKRFNKESEATKISPEQLHDQTYPPDANIIVGCNPDVSRNFVHEEHDLQRYENSIVKNSENDEDNDVIQHYDFPNDQKSTRLIASNRVHEKKDDDSVTLIHPRRWRRVLIVDDVPMNCKMLRRLFSNRFEECKEAENGKVAVDMVTEAMASGVSFDVITMDYQMPVMDGVTATRCIRKLGYKGLIVAVTGNALSEDVNAFLSNGADIVLTKPLSIERLYKYLNTAI